MLLREHQWREETLSMELRCLSWQAEWFWRAYILIVIIDFGSVFFSCKVIVVVEGEVWQFITQHSRISSLSSYVGKKKKKQNKIPLHAYQTITRQNAKTLWKCHCYEKKKNLSFGICFRNNLHSILKKCHFHRSLMCSRNPSAPHNLINTSLQVTIYAKSITSCIFNLVFKMSPSDQPKYGFCSSALQRHGLKICASHNLIKTSLKVKIYAKSIISWI